MKTFIAALAVTFGLATTASAELAWVGSAEYAVEAETISLEAGAEYTFGAFTINPMLLADDVAGSFEFTGAEVGVTYGLNGNIDLYGTIEADDELSYEELTVGVAFKF